MGDGVRILLGDQIPPGWQKGFETLAARRKEEEKASMITQLLDTALFAAQKHSGQRRKDAEASPYINHPLALAHLLATSGGVTDLAVLCAALLHDTVEDTETSFEELEQRFGPKITSIVREVTDDKSLAKQDRKRRQIEKAAGKSHEAKLVKLADKISNLGDILRSPPADWSDDRKLEYFEWAGQVIDGLRGTNAALEAEFDRLLAQGRKQFCGQPK
jgi:guanosine-3',5'-bis(diphosphate) 3'-pyrophosphohydrolase